MALEGDALLVELAKARQRHDLEAARIRQDRALPADQAMQTAEPRDAFGAWAQHQVVGIAENDVGAKILHLVEIHRLDRADGTDGHEGRCADRAARHGHFAATGLAVGLV
ncbi:hypothetical protein N185_27280 [Sinorhizobium sp. GW3]|nr:hypothetical protein N185_27280 [Sinorhizobium sp. GW3]